MNDDLGDEPQPISTRLPLAMGTDGQPYLGCDAVIALLRSISTVCRTLPDEVSPDLLANVLDLEADALDCRAIQHTMKPAP